MDKLVMEINDYHSINHAKIEINKINVVGGVNGSGKSTASRMFYSFLKANSTDRKDFNLKCRLLKINLKEEQCYANMSELRINSDGV